MSAEEVAPASEVDDLDRLERELQQLIGGPLIRSVNGCGGEVYLARSWLGRIHRHVLEVQGGTVMHDDLLIRAGKRQRLVAIANRLDLDVEQLLEAEPEDEVATIYEALQKRETEGR